MNFQEFENYIEQLCEQHTDLGHGINGRVAFARIMSEDEVNTLATNAHHLFVVIENVSAQRTGELQNDKYRLMWTLLFLGKADLNTGDLTTSRDNVIQLTWEIMMQFVAKMQHDFIDDDCGPLKGVVFEKIGYQVLNETALEFHYGWLLTLPQQISAPVYDETKWTMP